MRSTRLAMLAVAVGSALLGWSAAGVSAVAGDLDQATTTSTPGVTTTHHHHDHPHHRGHGGV
jgi:hypothetical protein